MTISGRLVRHRDRWEEYYETLGDCPYYRRGQPGADPKGAWDIIHKMRCLLGGKPYRPEEDH